MHSPENTVHLINAYSLKYPDRAELDLSEYLHRLHSEINKVLDAARSAPSADTLRDVPNGEVDTVFNEADKRAFHKFRRTFVTSCADKAHQDFAFTCPVYTLSGLFTK